MQSTRNIRCADTRLIVNVIRRSLSCIDERLIEHGERVAYIAGRIADAGGLDLDRQKLLVLCMLHDIGAYKTEEINNMVRFETDDVTDHAVFGYVFLLNTTSLGRYAEAILYHHTRYDELAPLDTPYKTMAALIFLADRIDILLHQSGEIDWQQIRRRSGTYFCPEMVSMFFDAEQRYNVSGHVSDGSCRAEVDARLDAITVTGEEIDHYLSMLVYSIDFRSPFTVTHTANTTTASTVLAGLLGLNEQERQAVALGAFLHDVGKIVIPGSVLEKPGRLNEEETALMRTHVTASGDILDGLVSKEVYQIAVRHHEKLDGSGYPLGLCGSELTLPQRIVAVADILCALIGRRSYKEPFSDEKTIGILAAMRDEGKLCPVVCQTVIDNYDEIIRQICLVDDPVVSLYRSINSQYNDIAAQLGKPRSPADG